MKTENGKLKINRYTKYRSLSTFHFQLSTFNFQLF
ncbi:hypothetical protein BACUNI_03765 [Bacteroides uniformis ATCC 8492]|uniref:Transposase n=1 Tax=Bacteroides uniformis (strain ATCC 8492 / DSM 6597 / CCUG 4942 / CIP 103695 / JCM 5828 / KCTC 5204 / NCTC 13054 / VPI 0061) TaxID=411479 RepID=A0ABC9N868_BACUC|nr:hypothetical protein BACUNI_03765 [Bacteroides uniformis ATCC 8492]